ncbi:MAG: hypothetical protein B5M56_07210 [Desulfococcus sp. 4484_241]|nr:MAG: hypothetical protein B5M56_07210 [Desulfococcus sp. 4484_241]
MLDVSVAYNRYKFLGCEFLTWLWFLTETGPGSIVDAGGKPVTLVLGNRIVLENHRRESMETITIKGSESELEEGRLALKKGAVVTEMNLNMVCDDKTWTFDIKGESLELSGLKVPDTDGGADGELETVVLEKIASYEKVQAFVRHMYARFIRLRVDGEWDRKTVGLIRKWMLSSGSD